MRDGEMMALLEEVFELDPGEIDESTPFEQIPGLESMTFLGLIAKTDQRFGVTLSPETVLGIGSVGNLIEHVRSEMDGQAEAA